jgi:hypothetical protein
MLGAVLLSLLPQTTALLRLLPLTWPNNECISALWKHALSSILHGASQASDAAFKTWQQLTRHEVFLLAKLDNSELRKACNEGDQKSGHGRLMGEDGSFLDIGGSTGGAARGIF